MPTLDDLIAEAALRKTELARETGIAPATITRISHGGPTTRVTVNNAKNLTQPTTMTTIRPLNKPIPHANSPPPTGNLTLFQTQ